MEVLASKIVGVFPHVEGADQNCAGKFQALNQGRVGWIHMPLDSGLMREAARLLIGEHDFSAFRSAQCQAHSPVKTLRSIAIARHGAYWRFDFDASAFLHHMVRNLMGGLVAVGTGVRPAQWLAEVLAARDRALAAPTFSADGLYFLGPYYDAAFDIPSRTPAMDWLVGGSASPHDAANPDQDLRPDA